MLNSKSHTLKMKAFMNDPKFRIPCSLKLPKLFLNLENYYINMKYPIDNFNLISRNCFRLDFESRIRLQMVNELRRWFKIISGLSSLFSPWKKPYIVAFFPSHKGHCHSRKNSSVEKPFSSIGLQAQTKSDGCSMESTRPGKKQSQQE